jgi:hypothetical protein
MKLTIQEIIEINNNEFNDDTTKFLLLSLQKIYNKLTGESNTNCMCYNSERVAFKRDFYIYWNKNKQTVDFNEF